MPVLFYSAFESRRRSHKSLNLLTDMASSLSKNLIMLWTFALWLMFAVLISSESITEKYHQYRPYSENSHGRSIQSPVNIDTNYVKMQYLPFIRTHGYLHMDNATVKITNTGHTVSIKLVNNFKITPYISSGPLFQHIYVFEQIHFHWGKHDGGSEHEINGQKYALEVHVVHYKKDYGSFDNAQNYDDGVCVVAFFGQITVHDNPELSKYLKDLRHIKEPKSSIFRNFGDELSWFKIFSSNQQYFTYHGSLTTFPFTECVIWIVLTEKIDISRHQLNKFRGLRSNDDGRLIYENSRPLQPINDETVIIHKV